MKDYKVVGAGLNKTGTSTLKKIMRDFGYAHCTWNLDHFNLFRDSEFSQLQQIIVDNESFENWPWALMYKEIDQWHPNSRFILTFRKDAETWYKSLCRHYDKMGALSDYEIHIYGYANPYDNKSHHIDYYHQHNAEVREYFKNRPHQLLEICIDDDLDWQPLCQFLNEPMPSIAFPHENKTPSHFEKLIRKIRPILGRYKQTLLGKK